MNKLTRTFSGIIVTIFFLALVFIIAYKAVHVPITHDELSATLGYPPFTVWQIMMYTDNWPSNHILNTLCIKFEEFALGMEPWQVRLHSVISFLIFFAVICLIARRYFAKWWLLFCVPFFFMFCNPFLLDFYSLARGYGLSNAMMACSVYCLLRFTGSYRIKWHYLSVIFAMLAAYANFTLLIYWVAIQALLIVLIALPNGLSREGLKKTGIHTLFTLILGLAFLALCYQPLYKMQSTNQFIYWSRESFFRNTMVNQVDEFRYGLFYAGISSDYGAKTVSLVLILTGIYVFFQFVKNGLNSVSKPVVILFGLLMLVYGINMMQAILLGTPYLTSRTALSYYVLFAFLLMFCIAALPEKMQRPVTPVFLVFLSLHLIRAVSFTHVKEWQYDCNTYTVTNYLLDYRQKHTGMQTVDLNTTWLFNPSFSFYQRIGKTPWLNITQYHKEVDTASQTLFYYAFNDDTALLKNYTPVLNLPESNSVLLINKNAMGIAGTGLQ